MTEMITIEVAWDAPDGTLDDLENEGDVNENLIRAALAALENEKVLWLNARRDDLDSEEA